MNPARTELLLADRLWIAVAILQREFPDHEDFSKDEIRSKLEDLGLTEGIKSSSINAHLKQHLVANVPPSSTGYRMLFEPRAGYLRLFRPSDQPDPRRKAKSLPKREELPAHYHSLLDWYEDWSKLIGNSTGPKLDDDPLILLVDSGRHIWADEHADDYVNHLRQELA